MNNTLKEKEVLFNNEYMKRFLFFGVILVFGCSPRFQSLAQAPADEQPTSQCSNAIDKTMEFFVQNIGEQKSLKIAQLIESDFVHRCELNENFSQIKRVNFCHDLYSVFMEFNQNVERISQEEKNSNRLEIATQLKLDDSETPLRKETLQKLRDNLVSESLLDSSCTLPNRSPAADEPNTTVPTPINPKPDTPPPVLAEPISGPTDIKKAMEKVFAVTYQSCDVLNLKPLTQKDTDIKGISEKCCDESGRGLLRHIIDIKSVQDTHYYLPKTDVQNQCFDVRSHPIIYDYGGRPAYTLGSKGILNFFENNGGTEVLGYDCSALVYTVLMAGGFRLRENKNFPASDVEAAQSVQFINPESKKWNCLERVTMNQNQGIETGDIVAYDGHIVMIYDRSDDPFNLSLAKNCDAITSKQFNFKIFQSSPSKNGIGVNVFEAKDYLLENSTMENIFLTYAKAQCRSQKTGQAVKILNSKFSILRTKNIPACRMPPVKLAFEECLAESCPRLK